MFFVQSCAAGVLSSMSYSPPTVAELGEYSEGPVLAWLLHRMAPDQPPYPTWLAPNWGPRPGDVPPVAGYPWIPGSPDPFPFFWPVQGFPWTPAWSRPVLFAPNAHRVPRPRWWHQQYTGRGNNYDIGPLKTICVESVTLRSYNNYISLS